MRFSTCDARLRNSAIHVAYSREPQSMRHMRPRFHNPCGIYGRVSAIYIMQQYIADTEAYRHKLVSFSIPQSLHYIKKAQGCAEGRGLVPLCGFLTFQCDLPSAGFRSPCGIQQGAAIYAVIRPEFRNPCGIYGRSSAIHAGIRPGPPQPMRLLFPHTKFRKYLINKVFPK